MTRQPKAKGTHELRTLPETTETAMTEAAPDASLPRLKNGLPIFAYDVNDFALAVGIGRTKIYEMIKDGRLKAGWLEGKRIIPATEAKRIIDAAMEL